MALARAATPFVKFDNLPRDLDFGGDALDACLTDTQMEFRLLGVTETMRVDWRTVIFVTGNALRVAGDTRRRTLVCQLVAKVEDPSARTDFKQSDLLGWVQGRRPDLAVAALTALSAFNRAGRPERAVLGSYGGWASLVVGCLLWCGMPDPLSKLASRATDDVDEDPERLARLTLLRALQGQRMTKTDGSGDIDEQEGVTAKWVAENMAGDVGEAFAVLVPLHRRADRKTVSAAQVGSVCRGMRDGIVHGLKLVSRPDAHRRAPTRWVVEGEEPESE
jgi:hypothetical protein